MMFGKNQKFNDGEENAPEGSTKKATRGLFGLGRLLQRKTEEVAPLSVDDQKPKSKPGRKRPIADSADLTAEILKVAAESQAHLPTEQAADTLLLEGENDPLRLPTGSTETPAYAFGNEPAGATLSDSDAIMPADGFHIGHPSDPAPETVEPASPSVPEASLAAFAEPPAQPLLPDTTEPPTLLFPPHEDLLLAAINRHLDSVQPDIKKEREPVLKIEALPVSTPSPEDLSLADAVPAPESDSVATPELDEPNAANGGNETPEPLSHEAQFLAAIEAHMATSPVIAIGPVVAEAPPPAAPTESLPETTVASEPPAEDPSLSGELPGIADQPLPAANDTPENESDATAETPLPSETLTPENDGLLLTSTASPDEAAAAGPIDESAGASPAEIDSEKSTTPAIIIPGLETSPAPEQFFAGPPIDPVFPAAPSPQPETAPIAETAPDTLSIPADPLRDNDPAQTSITPAEAIDSENTQTTADQPEAATTLNSENAIAPDQENLDLLSAGPSAEQPVAPHADDVLAAIERHLEAAPPVVPSSAAADQDLVSEIIKTAQASNETGEQAGDSSTDPVSPPQPTKSAGKLLSGIEDALLNEDLPPEPAATAESQPLPTEPQEAVPAPAKGIGGWLKRKFRKQAPETPAPVASTAEEPAAGDTPPAVVEASADTDHSEKSTETNPSAAESDGPERNLVHLYQSVGLSESEVASAAKAQAEGPANTELISAIIETAKKSQEERTKVLGGEFTDQVSIEAAELEKKKLRHERLILISRFCAGFSLIVPICSWIVFQAVLDSDSKISSLLKAENHGAVHAVLQTKKTEKENQLGVISKEINVIKEQTASIRENKIIKGIMEQRVDFLGIMLRVNETTLKALNLTPDLNNAIHMLVFNSYTGRLDNGNANITISGTVRDPKRLSISKLTYLIESINGDDHFNGVELRTFAKSDDELGGTQSAFNFNFKFFPKTDAVETTLKAAAPNKKKKKK